MAVRNKDSTDKILSQCTALSTQNNVILSESFWRTYHCPLGCGGCCYAFTLDYLPSEWNDFESRYSAERSERLVRGKPIVTIEQVRKQKMCHFLDMDRGSCLIHECSPISCRLELIKIKRIKNTTYLSKGPYARGWAMKAIDGGPVRCRFSAFSETQLFENDIPVLRQLLAWANHFEITTHLSVILSSIELAYDLGNFTRMSFGALV